MIGLEKCLIFPLYIENKWITFMVIFSISGRSLFFFSFLAMNPSFRAIMAVRIHFKEKKMVSTKTQIAGFEFDNCLMNAAGVA